VKLNVQVDEKGLFGRSLTNMEKDQLPFALMLATNQTAFDVRELWKVEIPKVFDRPTPLTQNAILYTKATKQRPFAEVFVRNEAFKGTAPEKYLQAQVLGGTRRQKRSEKWLAGHGAMPSGSFWVPAQGSKLDAYGNLRGAALTSILSAIGANPAADTAQTDKSRKRRQARERRKHGYTTDTFVLKKARGKLKAGVYKRINLGRLGSAVLPILLFVSRVTYRKRYPVFDLAKRLYTQQFPGNFKRAFERAMLTARIK
jgi:hypothetical protein